MIINNILYLPYYILKTPRVIFFNNISYLSKEQGILKYQIYLDILKCSIFYSTSFMDYFLLRFYDKSTKEREEYAGTGFMYNYQLKMNPKESRYILADKIEFFKHYSDFVGRNFFIIDEFEIKKIEITKLLENSKNIVLKNAKGQAGKEVEVVNTMPFDTLKKYMKEKGFDLLEEFVYQHKELNDLAPRGLNTIRIITQLTKNNQVDIIGSILRLSIDSNTDNLSVGNVAVSVDLKSGIVDRKAVYGDFSKEDIDIHPISGEKIVGFQIPFWFESIELVKNAALNSKGNKSIGWDIAITKNGPIIIEGNHNWGRALWQLPVNKGLKKILDQYV